MKKLTTNQYNNPMAHSSRNIESEEPKEVFDEQLYKAADEMKKAIDEFEKKVKKIIKNDQQ